MQPALAGLTQCLLGGWWGTRRWSLVTAGGNFLATRSLIVNGCEPNNIELWTGTTWGERCKKGGRRCGVL
eukprot:5472813-Amphidinium_carterae.1